MKMDFILTKILLRKLTINRTKDGRNQLADRRQFEYCD